MTNANDPVIPHLTYNQTSGNANGFIEGLTKREYFAAMAMQGLIANCFYGTGIPDEQHAIKAVQMADELINALNQQP